MPESPDEFYTRVSAAAGPDGRLPMPDTTGWEEIIPFDVASLRTMPLRPPRPEPVREGQDGGACRQCVPRTHPWQDGTWRLRLIGDAHATSVLVLMLAPLRHTDLSGLTDDEAAQFGRLVVHVARAIEGLPHVARAHVHRWGDGAEHLHVWFFARPAEQLQLRGSYLTAWEDILPPIPIAVRIADTETVARALADSYGGWVSPVERD